MYGRRGTIGMRGSMPFAAVAVTILVVTAAWAAAVYGSQRNCESTNDVENQETSVDAAEEHVSAWIERGLGEIISDVSTSQLGTMDDRREAFDERADEWMRSAFPAVDSGVNVSVDSWDFTLTSTILQMDSLSSTEGYSPAYLVAEGTVDAVFSGDDGRASRTFDVEADATSAAPLSSERGSLFVNAITGNGSILSQMMTYQLSCLAQYRVINGFGSLSYYGDEGTCSIVTSEDVSRSYESCLRAVSSLYLSTCDGGWTGGADAASVLLSEDELRIDLNSVYAQALYGVVDTIVARWFDYFGGAKLLSDLDDVADSLVTSWNSLVRFFTGHDTESVADYIRAVCGLETYGIGNGRTFTLQIEDQTVTLEYAVKDVLEMHVVRDFYEIYRNSTNGLRDWITGVVNRAVSSIAEQKSLGVLELKISKDQDFSKAVCDRTLEAINDCVSTLSGSLVTALKTMNYNDRQSEAVWHYIDDAKGDCLDYSMSSFASTYIQAINDALAPSGITVDEGYMSANESFVSAFSDWKSMVDDMMSDLRPLCEVAAKNDDILRDGCTAIVTQGLDLVDLGVDVTPWMRQICEEFSASTASSGLSGVQEYPESSGFTLVTDDDVSQIWLNLDLQSCPMVEVEVNEEMCTHGTSVSDSDVASYTTTWSVTVRDSLGYKVSSEDDVSDLVNECLSVFSGTSDVSVRLSVHAVSGWALTGVEYTATNTFFSDLENALFSVLLKLVDPFMDLLKSLQEVMDMISEVAAKLCGIAEDVMERLFSVMNSPLLKMQDRINEILTSTGCETLLDILENVERSYGITLTYQTFKFSYGGWTITTTLYLGTLDSYTKHLCKTVVTGDVGGAEFSTTVDVKIKGSSTYTPVVTGSFKCTGDDWSFDGKLDPFMSSEDYMVEAEGTVRGTWFKIDVPVLNQYKEVDLSLCDVAGLGTVLSNIPFIVPGTLVSIDAGIDVKYDVPVTAGVIINEVEANPAGDDKDNEWAEILNLSAAAADLSGWTLVTSKDKTYEFPEGTKLAVGARTVAEFTGAFLNNSNETLTLKDSEGKVVQKVTLKSDTLNNERTCQRGMDGLTTWGLYTATRGEPNEGGLFGKDGTVTKACYDILADSAKDALSDLGGKVTTEDELAQLIQLTLKKALDEGIDELSSCLIEASLYIEVEFTDVSSSVTLLGFRVHLTADKDLVADTLRYLVGNVANLVFGVEDPYNIDLGDAFMDDVLLGVTFYTGHGLPSVLDPSGDKDVLLGVDVCINLAGVCGAIGMDSGPMKIKAGVLARNVPYSVLPSFMDADKFKTNDLWLMVVTLRPGGQT